MTKMDDEQREQKKDEKRTEKVKEAIKVRKKGEGEKRNKIGTSFASQARYAHISTASCWGEVTHWVSTACF